MLDQTYRDIELIIVDDCSTDNTREVVCALAQEDPRVRYIRHEINRGACAARNTGIEAAQGEYIAFQDSDDAWRPEKLERQIAVMNRYDADICYCQIQRHQYAENIPAVHPDLAEGIVDYETLITGSHASTQTILVKTQICRENPFDTALKRLQDYDWCIRVGRDYCVSFVKEILVDVYLQADSITSVDAEKTAAGYRSLLKKHESVGKEYPAFEICLLNIIVNYSVAAGEKDGTEFRRLYQLTGNRKYFLKSVLQKTGILTWRYQRKAAGHI